MKFEKPTPEMTTLFDSIVPVNEKGVETRKMFGNPACFMNGNMFMALHNNKVLLRLGEDDRERLVRAGGKIFEPMPGRLMKEYVLVPKEMQTASALHSWVRSSVSHASGLAPKRKKPRKAAK